MPSRGSLLFLYFWICIIFCVRHSSCKFLAIRQDERMLRDSQLVIAELGKSSTWKSPDIRVFLSPTFTAHEKAVIRDAFKEFRTKTCLNFEEEEYVPWYHWKRWEVSHIVFRPSNRVNLMVESKMDDAFNRTLMYMSRESLNKPSPDLSRGIVLHELCRVLGLGHENERPDAAVYMTLESSFKALSLKNTEFRLRRQRDAADSLRWPFDPTSVTIAEPSESSKFGYRLSSRCIGVRDSDIAKGMKIGRLTFWDTIKIDSLYCPEQVPVTADHTPGPCENSGRLRVAGVRSSSTPIGRHQKLRRTIRHRQLS